LAVTGQLGSDHLVEQPEVDLVLHQVVHQLMLAGLGTVLVYFVYSWHWSNP